MKIAVHLIDNENGLDHSIDILHQISELNSAPVYLIWSLDNNIHTTSLLPHQEKNHSDLSRLVQLVLSHPLLAKRPGITAPINAQLLNLLGLHQSIIETFREELIQHQCMIITSSRLLFTQLSSLKIKHNFYINLHSNLHHIIRKASLNLLQIPVTERLTHDYSL